ncbi:MAG: hypothetical protein Q7L07_12880 [Pseudohongiella sp.]|nr:hypothetical protein [Pseudohongiella sp.]MDP2283774.1 hypothetical protein [Pseudohongiella sp.]
MAALHATAQLLSITVLRETKMKYEFELIDNSESNNPVYKLNIDPTHKAFSKFDIADVKRVVSDLEYSLCFLFNSQLTFDGETLLPSAWLYETRSQHNKTTGRILSIIVERKLAPLVRLPKGSGSRIRFRINE